MNKIDPDGLVSGFAGPSNDIYAYPAYTDWKDFVDDVMFVIGFIPILDCASDTWFFYRAWEQGDYAMMALIAGCLALPVISSSYLRMGKTALKHADDALDLARGVSKTEDIGKASKAGGRLGGVSHRAKVDEIAKDIKLRGLVAKKEYYIKGAGVRRFADVAAIDPSTEIAVEMYQVGRTTKGGLPVWRERGALSDIMSWAEENEMLGLKLNFVPYSFP